MIQNHECVLSDSSFDECLAKESQENAGQFDLIPQVQQNHCDLARQAIDYVIAEIKSAADDTTLSNLVPQLDEVADYLETAQEFVIAKMQLAMDASLTVPVKSKVPRLDLFLRDEQSELCAWSAKSARKLLGYCHEKIDCLPIASFDTDGLGNVVVNWDLNHCTYQWTIVKSDLKWPMIQVYEYFEDSSGGDSNVFVWFNAASLFKSFQQTVSKHGPN